MEIKYGEKVNRIASDLDQRGWVKPTRDFVLWTIFLLLISAGLVTRVATRSVSIGEKTTEYIEYNAEADEAEINEWTVMSPMQTDKNGAFYIQLPVGVRANGISVGNYYQDHSLLVKLKGAKASNFAIDKLSGDVSNIVSAAYRDYKGELCISIQMDGLWDYDISQENNQLVITPFKTESVYDYVVVLVPVKNSYSVASEDGSTAEAVDITGKVADFATQMAEVEGVRVFVSRQIGREKSDAETLAFIEEADADAVVLLDLSSDVNTEKYGLSALYNSKFYTPNLDNGTLAESFLRNITIESSNKAESIDEADEESMLMSILRPAAQINIGYVTNEKEYGCLINEDYQKQLARGVVGAIEETIEKIRQ